MKKVKAILLIVAVFILFISSANLILAKVNDKSIIYNGRTKSFSYYNISKNDLFTNFKELMPGDSKKETILFKTENINSNTTLYAKFISIGGIPNNDIMFRIYRDDKLIHDDYLYKDVNELINLTEFSKDATTKLTFELYVPTSVSNEVSDLSVNAKFDFIIKEEGSENTINPKTYDDISIYIVMFALSLISIIVILLYNKKESKEKVNG